MQRGTKLKVFAFLLAVAGAIALGNPAAPKAKAQQETPPKTKKTAAVVYTYTTQPNDSFSLLARKAVQTYGLKTKTKLSPAQIIFAETHLTQDAGSPQLDVNQHVEISEQAVKSWVEKAGKFTTAQKAAWAQYAQYANFNTDQVGES